MEGRLEYMKLLYRNPVEKQQISQTHREPGRCVCSNRGSSDRRSEDIPKIENWIMNSRKRVIHKYKNEYP